MKEMIKVEQVPGTWEELKKKALAFKKKKKGICIILKHYLDNGKEFLSIRKDKNEFCQIKDNEIRFWGITTTIFKIDIQHSWLIIKGIMEE